MKQFRILFAAAAFSFVFFVTSCVTEDSMKDAQELSLDDKIDKAYFAKKLARALVNEEVRDVIKTNSLAMFNGDNDVLVELVKDIPLSNGKTFLEEISEYADDPDRFIRQVENSELLTIFVPKLEGFTPETWNVAEVIPNVAVRIDEEVRTGRVLFGYNALGETLEMSYSISPDTPTLVVKDNERVELVDSSNNNGQEILKVLGRGSIALKSNEYSGKSSFVNSKVKPKEGLAGENFSAPTTVNTPWGGVIPVGLGAGSDYFNKLTTGYNKYSFSYDRDWIYYNIKNDSGSGRYSTEYAEFINGFYINNPITANALNGVNDDWTEGQYEIVVKILFLSENQSVQEITKMFSVSVDDLIKTINGNQVSYYFPIPPIEIAPWDLVQFGDTWKFVLSEFNQGQTTTYDVVTTSKFSANAATTFGFDLFGIIKFGANLGGSGETTKTSTHTITTTTTSYPLGEAFHIYKNSVLQNGRALLGAYPSPEIVLHYISGQTYINFPYTTGLNTGMVTLNVVPLKRSGRPTTDTEYLNEAYDYYNNY